MFKPYLRLWIILPELKVQLISKSLYVCIPSELLKGDQNRDMPPLDIGHGDVLIATRTKDGILYEPRRHEGSAWVMMPTAVD